MVLTSWVLPLPSARNSGGSALWGFTSRHAPITSSRQVSLRLFILQKARRRRGRTERPEVWGERKRWGVLHPFGARMESTGSPYWCSKRRQGSQKWQIDANGLKTLNEDHLENKGDGGGVYPFLQSSKTSLQLGCLLFLEVMKFWLNEVKCHIRRWPLPAGRPGKSGLCPAATESRWRRWAKQLGCVRVRSGLSGVGRGKAQTRLMTGTDWHIYIH